jgi:hypothetical protein
MRRNEEEEANKEGRFQMKLGGADRGRHTIILEEVSA